LTVCTSVWWTASGVRAPRSSARAAACTLSRRQRRSQRSGRSLAGSGRPPGAWCCPRRGPHSHSTRLLRRWRAPRAALAGHHWVAVQGTRRPPHQQAGSSSSSRRRRHRHASSRRRLSPLMWMCRLALRREHELWPLA
jgi:hypothetical protein